MFSVRQGSNIFLFLSIYNIHIFLSYSYCLSCKTASYYQTTIFVILQFLNFKYSQIAHLCHLQVLLVVFHVASNTVLYTIHTWYTPTSPVLTVHLAHCVCIDDLSPTVFLAKSVPSLKLGYYSQLTLFHTLFWLYCFLLSKVIHTVNLSSIVFLFKGLSRFILVVLFLLSTTLFKMHFFHFTIYLTFTSIRVCDSSKPTMHSDHPVIILSGIHPCVNSINYASLSFQSHCRSGNPVPVTRSLTGCLNI